MINTDYPLIATKLHTPKPRRGIVRRKHLIERMNKGIRSKLMLVSAPAGFGKTTFLTEWIDQIQWPVAWISLDNSDSDPVYFIKYVIAALQKIELEVGETALSLLRSPQHPPFDAIIINLIQDIEDISSEFALVLDDYHSIDNAEIHQLVALLIDHMPPQMHLVVATRVDPNLSLARLRVQNQLTEFRVSDLSFTEDETAHFFNKVMKLDLSKADIAILASRTEGWVAGLQLAALSMQGRSDISSFLNDFAGDDRHIVDYLAEEVLNLQPDDIKDFLLHTSILNRLSEPLCNYVTNQQGSQKLLDYLEKANLFLVPLDNKRDWYRYHHLFADLLRQRLNQRWGDVVKQLHMKASEWFEANAFKEEAIEHALAAKENNRAADLIEAFILGRWHGGEQFALFNWLDQLPDEIKLSRPNLGLYHAQVLFQSGRQEVAEKLIDQLERRHVSTSKKAGRISKGNSETQDDYAKKAFQGRIAAIKAYFATRKGDIPGIVKYSKQALACLPKEDATWRAIVTISSAIVHELKGDAIASIDAHSEAIDAAMKAGNVYFCLIEKLWLAIVLKNSGRLPEAMDICRQLLNEANEKKLAFNAAVGNVWATWAEMLYELNDLEEAHRYAKKGVELMEHGHDVSHLGWQYCCLAKILCSKQNLADAEEIAFKMDKLMATSVVPPWVLSQIQAVKARIFMMKGDMDVLQRWVNEFRLTLDSGYAAPHDAEHIMVARILMVQGRFDDALGLLDRLIVEDEKAGRVLNQIETLLLKALVLKKINHVAESMVAIQKALFLAEPGGYTRVFIDEGRPMAELLEKSLDVKGNDIPKTFVNKLLPVFKLRKVKSKDGGLVEKLSEREMEVLMFVAAGMSNKKIAEELFISLSTVKTHLQNIYGKLNVHSRTEAIVKAKELGFLK